MNTNDSYNGIIRHDKGTSIPFQYENGVFEIFIDRCGISLATLQKDKDVVVEKRGLLGEYMLFHFPFKFEGAGAMQTEDESGTVQSHPITIGTVKHEPEYYIDHYKPNSLYAQMVFEFSELDYFLPSINKCEVKSESVLFHRALSNVCQFQFEYHEKPLNFTLCTGVTVNCGVKRKAKTVSQLVLEFDATDDMTFILGLYHSVHQLFSFICNRQNLALYHVSLIGTYQHEGLVTVDGKNQIGDTHSKTSQELVIINKYRAEAENEKITAKISNYATYSTFLEPLYKMILNDEISLSSIHASIKDRSLLDLKHCLQITSSFEYYQRTYLPTISSDETIEFFGDINNLIDEYICTHKGKKKKAAKGFKDSLSPTISLEQRILKTYLGYGSWHGLSAILGDWFGNDVSDFALAANKWRNELAHEKRAYEPDENVVMAIKLLEHMNYCIVLRKAGCSDDGIKHILNETLARFK